MGKRSLFTTITPLPAKIPRQLAIDMLHNHTEMIELNPLVIQHRPIKAPKSAPADEFFAVWHELTDKVQYLPGVGIASSKVTYRGVFHDMPWGLQTHIYAPLGLDIRNKWQIRGNQPGEPREVRELGDTAPHEGLYLREDVDMVCNRMMTGFVKKTLKAAHAVLVDRLMKKAELLDAGTLRAMMENGRLKTVNPAVEAALANTGHMPRESPELVGQSSDPQAGSRQSMSPQLLSPQQSYYAPKEAHPAYRGHDDNRQSTNALPPYPDHGNYYNDMAKSGSSPGAYARQSQQSQYSTTPSQQVAAELPGSMYHSPQSSPRLPAPDRNSTLTELSASPVQRNFPSPNLGSSDRSSTTSEQANSYNNLRGLPSPSYTTDRTSMISELATPPLQQSGFQYQRPR